MSHKRFHDGFVVKRFSLSLLNDVIYFNLPMSREFAETIRFLRRDHRLSYDEVMWALSEGEPEWIVCSSYGKALVERAALELGDDDRNWG